MATIVRLSWADRNVRSLAPLGEHRQTDDFLGELYVRISAVAVGAQQVAPVHERRWMIGAITSSLSISNRRPWIMIASLIVST